MHEDLDRHIQTDLILSTDVFKINWIFQKNEKNFYLVSNTFSALLVKKVQFMGWSRQGQHGVSLKVLHIRKSYR